MSSIIMDWFTGEEVSAAKPEVTSATPSPTPADHCDPPAEEGSRTLAPMDVNGTSVVRRSARAVPRVKKYTR